MALAEIRPARASDAARLAELRWEFRAGRKPASEPRDGFLARAAAWMAEALESGAWQCWVAERDDAIVGQIWLHPLPKVPNPNGECERHAYVSNVYVTPSARGGVGTRLLDAAIAWASAHHVDRIVLWPTPRSRPMYERHGFKPNGDVLELDVSRACAT